MGRRIARLDGPAGKREVPPAQMAKASSTQVSSPHVSIVIPVYNEEPIIQSAVIELIDRLGELPWTYELILAENGSRDATVELAEKLAERFPQVRTFSFGQPNYGGALKRGILEARGEYVICDEIDLCDTDFYVRALALLEAGE